MEKYNEYKESGIDWLGVIPAHWEVLKAKQLCSKIGDGLHGTPSYDKNGAFKFINGNNLNDGVLNLKNARRISKIEYLKIRKKINNNTIFYSINGTIGNIAFYNNESIALGKSVAYLNLKLSSNKYYYRYFLMSNVVFDFFNLEQTGTTINNLSLNTLNNTFYLIPPIKEQTLIANYLDAKTTAIDKKVNLLQQKIKHYKAYRKTLINETVTKGLDKTVKLKDSGINWIGSIPEHWEVKRLKSVGYISTSSVNKKIEDDEKIVSLVNYTDVYGNLNKEIWNNSSYMKVSAKPNQIIQKNLKKGDVLFTPSSETVEDIGVSSLVMDDLKNTLYSYHILRLRFNHKIYDNFKKYMFNNDFVQYYFSKSAKGTTRKILGLNDFNNLQVVLPPTFEEQQEIADYLDAKTSTIDKVVKNIETQITTLKELRKTLISEVVTGKVKVSA